MAETVQNKARKFVVAWYNTQVTVVPRPPIGDKDVRIIFWKNVIQEDTWYVVLWVRNPEPSFYIVEHHRPTGDTHIDAYTEFDTKVLEKGKVRS